MEKLLNKVRVQGSEPVDEEEPAEIKIVDLGHAWDSDFITDAYGIKWDIDTKAKEFIYDAIVAKRAGLADGSVEYYVKEDKEKERKDVARMRD